MTMSLEQPRRVAALAAALSLLTLWLLVPPFSSDLGGFWLRKTELVRLLPLLLVAWLHPRALLFRWHWLDAPVVLYCSAPCLAAVLNGLSRSFALWEAIKEFEYWFIPYWLGRSLFVDEQARQLLARVLIWSGVAYLPLVWLEIWQGPFWTECLTGETVGRQVRGADRDGSFRPSVFLDSGFVLTMHLGLACLAAIASCGFGSCGGLRAALAALFSRVFRRGRHGTLGEFQDAGNSRETLREFRSMGSWYKFRYEMVAALVLAASVLASRSLGSIVLLTIGCSWLALFRWGDRRTLLARGVLLGLVCVPASYMAVRLSGWLTEQAVHDAAALFTTPQKADSLAFRLRAEEQVFQAMQGHWWWGWGSFHGWLQSGDRIFLDGFWPFTLTRTGMVTVVAWLAMVMLPILTLIIRQPVVAPAEKDWSLWTFALFLALSLIDSQFNYFGAAPQMLLVGAMTAQAAKLWSPQAVAERA